MPRSLILETLFVLLILSGGCQSTNSTPYLATTLVPTLTMTPRPSQTVSPIPTHTRTPNFLETKSYKLYQKLTVQALTPTRTEFPIPTIPPVLATLGASNWYISPDKKWYWWVPLDGVVEKAGEGFINYQYTYFASIDGKTVWKIRPVQSDLDSRPHVEVSYWPIFWLPSEPYVYLSGRFCCIDGPGIHFLTGWNLVRLDLRNGNLTKQISGWEMHDFSFSLNGDYLFDAQNDWGKVKIINLVDGKEIEVHLPSAFHPNGNGVFSPDRKQVVFESCEYDPDRNDCKRIMLILADTQTGIYHELLHDLAQVVGQDRSLDVEMEWVTDHRIKLIEGQNSDRQEWILEVEMGVISKIMQ